MMASLTKIEGIGSTFAAKLAEAGLKTTEQLLEVGKTAQGRTQLAEKAGISQKLILEWVNRADLFRVKGVGEEYSDLLEQSGVDTVPELARRLAKNLHTKMVEVNQQKRLVRALPTLAQVGDWIEQAKNLPRVVTY